MDATARTRWLAPAGWVLVLGLTLVALMSVAHRGAASWQALRHGPRTGEATNPFESRYDARPVLTLVHLVAGGVFLLAGPLQFIPAWRKRHWAAHRLLGRVYLVSGAMAALSALVFVAVLPVFGSFSSSVGSALGAVMFLWAAAMAYRSIRRRRVAAHREWMIRSYAIGLGIATFRVLLPGLMSPPFSVSFREAWDTVVWLGFVLNLIVAEWWIHRTRGPLPAAQGPPSSAAGRAAPNPAPAGR